jgi:hypothetical protein
VTAHDVAVESADDGRRGLVRGGYQLHPLGELVDEDQHVSATVEQYGPAKSAATVRQGVSGTSDRSNSHLPAGAFRWRHGSQRPTTRCTFLARTPA